MFRLLINKNKKTEEFFKNNPLYIENVEIIIDEITSENIKTADGVLAWTLSEEQLQNAKKLKVIFAPLTGLNGFPENTINERNIKIFNTHAKSKYIAEHAFALLLATMGKISKTDKIFKETHKWANRSYDDFWTSLYNKKVAFYGFGHIGKDFHSLIKPFNPTVHTLKRYEGRCDAHKFFDTLEELAENSDIMIVSTPLNEHTFESIDLNVLKKLGGFIVNVGRGSIIKEEDFYIALSENYIKGAGSDVWYNYPTDKTPLQPSNYPFHELDTIVMSPHTAWSTLEDKDIQFIDTVKNIKQYFKSN